MARALVILPAGTYRATDFVTAAEAIGIELSIASEEKPPLGLEDRFVAIDCAAPYRSAEAIVDLAARTPIDAIVPADDRGVLMAALAAERLGLPHNPPDAVATTRNKVMMRRRFEVAEIPQPSFQLIRHSDDAASVAADLGFPAVIKPLSLSGSRGVIRVDDPAGAAAAVDRIRRILNLAGANANEPLLIERFMPGPEVAVEAAARSGKIEVLAVFDKPDPLDGPYFEETLYVTPSRLHPEILDEVRRMTERSAAALGLVEGPVHAEFRITNGRVRVVEVAARTIGGLCGRSLEFGMMGTSLEALSLRNALGMPLPILRGARRASGVMMLPIPAEGRLRAVHGREAATAIPEITGVDITIPLGGRVVPLPEGDRYLGFIFGSAETPERVESALREAAAEVQFDID